jgi:hypothetical protein
MSLRTFHLVFISISVILAAFVAAWAVQECDRLRRDRRVVAGGGRRLDRVRHGVSAEDEAAIARRHGPGER